MSNLAPRYIAKAMFSDQGLGALVFNGTPSAGVAAQLAPFFKGDKGDDGAKGGVISESEIEQIADTAATAQRLDCDALVAATLHI